MARILVVTAGMIGMRYAAIELGRRLIADGHDVTLASPEAGPEARPATTPDLAQDHGLSFVPLAPDQSPEFRREDGKRGFLQRLGQINARRQQAQRATGVHGFSAVLDQLAPDLVLLDQEMHEHIVVAVGAGWPVALMNTFCSVWRQSGAPPPHTAITPGKGFRGSALGIGAAWTAFRLRKRLRFLRLALKHVGCDRRALLKRLASESAFDFHREADASQWLIPFTYPRFPALSLHALEFEFVQAPPAGVSFLGPMRLEERGTDTRPDQARERLDRLLANHAEAGSGRRLLYAGFGSVFTIQERWLRALFSAVAQQPEWDLVVSLGGREDRAALGEVPDNVHVFRWPPQLALLAQADAAIVHGGINTIDECVMARVPMLVCSGNETDMAGNMARVAYHGIGLAADARHDDAKAIERQLTQLLEDPAIAERLDHMRRAYGAYAEDRVAEAVVRQLLTDSAGKPG